MTPRPVWEHAPGVAFIDEGDRVVLLALLNLRPDGAQILTGSSAAIWRAADGANEDQIVETLAATFDLPAEQIQPEVAEFLAELASHNLIRPIDQTR